MALPRRGMRVRLDRRPTLTAPARDDMGEARVGTKERLSDRTKEMMKDVRRRAPPPHPHPPIMTELIQFLMVRSCIMTRTMHAWRKATAYVRSGPHDRDIH